MILPVIRHVPEGDGPDRTALELGPCVWGVIPDWFRGAIGAWKRPAFAARGEDILQSTVFRGAFRYRRCLVPVHGWYLWEGERGAKTRYAAARRDGDWICLAAVWERALIEGSSRDGVAVVTTGPNDVVAGLATRMPVVVAPEDYDVWLGSDMRAATRLIRPSPAEELLVWPSLDGYPTRPDLSSR